MRYLSHYTKDDKAIKNGIQSKARKLASLKTFYQYYFSHGKIKHNPAAVVEIDIKDKNKDIIFLQPQEVVCLLECIESGNGFTARKLISQQKTRIRDLAIVILLLGTGIRVSECVGLDLDSIDFENGVIHVTRKGNFNDEVENALSNYIEHDRQKYKPTETNHNALFLSSKHNRMSVGAVEYMIKQCVSIAPPHRKKITPHKMRSTFGSTLYYETGDIYAVADALGHSDVNTTKRHYAAVDSEKRRENFRKITLRE